MRRRTPPAAELTAEDLALMISGPWAIGLNLQAPAVQHGRLLALWDAHEDAIRAEAKRRGVG